MVDGGLRERKKARTRDRLVEVALTLFEVRGFDEVTVEEIADAAFVSPRTFYRYFGSKEAVLYNDQDELLALLRATILEHPADGSPWAAVQAGVLVMAQNATASRDRHLRRARLGQQTEGLGHYQRVVMQPLCEEVIAIALADRLDVDVDIDVRPRLLAGVGLAVMASLSHSWINADGLVDLEALVAQRFADLAGLAAEPGNATRASMRHGPGRTGTA